MERIVIIGSPGSGKSTLARTLHRELHIKVYHLDRLLWRADWERKDREIRIDILQKLVQEKRWIIEGNYLDFAEIYLSKADTIIFSDIPSLVCLWRVIQRHNRDHGHSRRDIPEGCTDKLTFEQMMKVQIFPLVERRAIEEFLKTYRFKDIIRLQSNQEIENFLKGAS